MTECSCRKGARCANCMERDGFISNRDPGDENDYKPGCPTCGQEPYSTWVDSIGYLMVRCVFGHIYRERLLTPREQREWPYGAA